MFRRAAVIFALGVVCALVVPAAGWASGLTATQVRIGDHPAYVRAVLDFANGRLNANEVYATDPDPFDGAVSLTVSRRGVRTAVVSGSAYGITVRVLPGSNRIRVYVRAARGRFKYLSYAVVTGDRLGIDLWKSAPPSRAAEIRRGSGGCLTLDGWQVRGGVVSATGRENALFEHQFQVIVRGYSGSIVARKPVHAMGGRWSAQIGYRATRWQPATLEAADSSAKDGALVCLVQLRVTLPAAGAGAAGVYVTNFFGASVSQYDVGVDGTLRPKTPARVAGGNAPLGVAVGPDRKSVYVAGADGVRQYDAGPGGLLTPKSPAVVASGGGPGWVVVSPNGRNAYATNIQGDSVSQYTIGPGGKLTPETPATVPVSFPRGLAISPNGRSVYVAVSGVHAGIAQFDVGPDGKLTPRSPAIVSGAVNPGWLAGSPDGRSLYVTSFSHGIYQYDVTADGTLKPKSPSLIRTSTEPTGIVVSPNGRSVYVANFHTNTIAQYNVGPGGRLTPKSPGTVPAGAAPEGLAISSNGKLLYVANINSSTVSQYSVTAGGKLEVNSPASIATGPNPYDVAIILGAGASPPRTPTPGFTG